MYGMGFFGRAGFAGSRRGDFGRCRLSWVLCNIITCMGSLDSLHWDILVI